MILKHSWLMATALLLGGGLAAQQKGSTPPAFEFKKVWNGGPASFEQLAGHVVILDFAATW